MKRALWLALLLLVPVAALNAGIAPKIAGTSIPSDPLPPWHVPDLANLPNDEHGQLVRYGLDLMSHTTALIGAEAPDPAQRYSGNGLECTNCHINGGTERYALPLVGIAGLYPAFSARLDARQDLAARVNNCMQRSMNGRALPVESREMQALIAYLSFLSTDQPKGDVPIGRGAPALQLPTRAADPGRGAMVYRNFCADCHQANGLGVKLQLGTQVIQRRRYLYPPLWGPESYNDAAGMARIVTAAWFVHANMPKGVNWESPLLGADEAYDVMAFVNTRPRPHKRDLARDYPNLWLKPIGTLYPPWVGNFSTAQNRFGPWQPILAWRRANPAARVSGELAAANDLEQSLHAASHVP